MQRTADFLNDLSQEQERLERDIYETEAELSRIEMHLLELRRRSVLLRGAIIMMQEQINSHVE